LNDVDSVIKVVAKAAFFNRRFEILVGCRKESDFNRDFLISTDRPNGAFF